MPAPVPENDNNQLEMEHVHNFKTTHTYNSEGIGVTVLTARTATVTDSTCVGTSMVGVEEWMEVYLGTVEHVNGSCTITATFWRRVRLFRHIPPVLQTSMATGFTYTTFETELTGSCELSQCCSVFIIVYCSDGHI